MSVDGLIEIAKVYARGRIQLPSDVREFLNLKDGDKIAFIKDSGGAVFIKKVEKPLRYSKMHEG